MKKYNLLFLTTAVFSVSLVFFSCPNQWMEKALDYRNITFNSNGGSSVPEQKLLRGEKIAAPADPKRYEFNFNGWYSDKEIKNIWNFNAAPSGNMTLYAGWGRYRIAISPGNIIFAPLVIGYNQLTQETVTVKNQGDQITGNLSVILSGDNPGSFTVTPDSIGSLSPGEEASFTIGLNYGLGEGLHIANVRVTNNSRIYGDFTVSVYIQKATPASIQANGLLFNDVYEDGESLDLTGLSVTVFYNFLPFEEFKYGTDEFRAMQFVVTPAHGTILNYQPGVNTKLIIQFNGYFSELDFTVNP